MTLLVSRLKAGDAEVVLQDELSKAFYALDFAKNNLLGPTTQEIDSSEAKP